MFQFGDALLEDGEAGGALFFHALERGDDEAVDLVLLRPKAVGVELEEAPDRFFQGDEERAEQAPALADLIGGRAPELEAGLVAQLAPARFG